MTEQELCVALGLLDEPAHNRFALNTQVVQQLQVLVKGLQASQAQKEWLGVLHTDLWSEFLPWNSLN
jgi:hypothetical protein